MNDPYLKYRSRRVVRLLAPSSLSGLAGRIGKNAREELVNRTLEMLTACGR
jgi:hypothetical protein